VYCTNEVGGLIDVTGRKEGKARQGGRDRGRKEEYRECTAGGAKPHAARKQRSHNKALITHQTPTTAKYIATFPAFHLPSIGKKLWLNTKRKKREQDNAVCEQRQVTWAFEVQLYHLRELGAYHRCGEALRGRGGMREEEEGREWVSHVLQREGEVRAQKGEDKVRWEGKERREGHAGPRRGRRPDAHVLHLQHQGLGPADEGGFRAGWQRGMAGGRIELLSMSS
jgi:hypothetical protein